MGRWGSGDGDRYSRHWYDPDRLASAGIAEASIRDRGLDKEVAQKKEDFSRAIDAAPQPLDYFHALSGNLQLVPTDAARQALESDYRAMTNSGMLRGEIWSFPSCWADQPAGGAVQSPPPLFHLKGEPTGERGFSPTRSKFPTREWASGGVGE
jgi:hypothetical protein